MGIDLRKLIGVVNLAQAILSDGYLAAKLDPLKRHLASDPILTLDFHDLSQEDCSQLSADLVGLPSDNRAGNASQAIEILWSIYCGPTGFDHRRIRNPTDRSWLQEVAETGRNRPPKRGLEETQLLDHLSQVVAFEVCLHRFYPGKTCFSIACLDMLIPMLDEIIGDAARANVSLYAQTAVRGCKSHIIC